MHFQQVFCPFSLSRTSGPLLLDTLLCCQHRPPSRETAVSLPHSSLSPSPPPPRPLRCRPAPDVPMPNAIGAPHYGNDSGLLCGTLADAMSLNSAHVRPLAALETRCWSRAGPGPGRGRGAGPGLVPARSLVWSCVMLCCSGVLRKEAE